MNNYQNRTSWMLFLFLFAVLAGSGSLVYTRYLVEILEREEREKVELWAESTRLLILADSSQNIEILTSIIENNNTIPVILTDNNDSITGAVNFEGKKAADPEFLKKKLEKLRKQNEPIIIDLGNGYSNNIYYKDSIILTQLIYYPYIQLGIILLFIIVAYLAFSSSRKAEYNQLWVSMSKETAHQLGTPTSSLAGWVEILQEKYPDMTISREIALDVERLEKITERFSRIGQKPNIDSDDITVILTDTVAYLKSRSSSKLDFKTEIRVKGPLMIPVNRALFEWVLENVSKNAFDAMEGTGTITYVLSETSRNVIIDISDTGKGIPKSSLKKIFNPGYSTKQRGWGLGLSLARRIVEEFHAGRIFVRYSEPGKGTCIRIILNKLSL